MNITLQHIRTVPSFNNKQGFCADKTKLFFKHHHLNFRDFVRHGIPEEELLATGDALAIKVVEWAHSQENN